MFRYFPHTDTDIEAMKRSLGIKTIDELFEDVPKGVFFSRQYDVPEMLSETEIRTYFSQLAQMNQELVCFAGLGTYDHYSPAVIQSIISRQEFLTAYTPYQPEVSQGTLQYIFEYQSMIQTLTGMDVANASMYDGATAAAEACFMAEAITRRKKILISETVNPFVTDVVKTYAHFRGLDIVMIPSMAGVTDPDALQKLTDAQTAAVLVQKPNFFGIIEDIQPLSGIIHAAGGILIENADISTLAVLSTPKADGADIAVGDCQSLGIPMAFGGPSLGYMATLKQHVRKLPGRICGMSNDIDGKRAFVLTLQAREQHIRREKANSNIWSNQSLMALYVTVYMTLLGPSGLHKVNELSYQGAHYLAERLEATGKFKLAFAKPFLKEFVMETLIPVPLMQAALLKQGFLGAIPLSEYGEQLDNLVAFAVTEKRTRAEIDRFVEVLEGLSW